MDVLVAVVWRQLPPPCTLTALPLYILVCTGQLGFRSVCDSCQVFSFGSANGATVSLCLV